jgi:hypothetical protein
MRRRTRLSVEQIEPRRLLSALAYSLTTNQSTYQAGQPIDFTFTETNTSAAPVNIAVGPVNSGFDVVHDGVTVWASNTGIQPQFLRLETLEPGQSATLTGTWNGVPNLVPPSVLTGTFTVTNQQAPGGAIATFQIESASSPPVQNPIQNDPALSATLTTRESAYRLGQPVTMTLTLTNKTDTSVTITPNPFADGFYVSRGHVLVWKQDSKASTDADLSIAPGQTVTFTSTWNGRPNQAGAHSARSGIYTLAADLGDYQVSTTIRIGRRPPAHGSGKG